MRLGEASQSACMISSRYVRLRAFCFTKAAAVTIIQHGAFVHPTTVEDRQLDSFYSAGQKQAIATLELGLGAVTC